MARQSAPAKNQRSTPRTVIADMPTPTRPSAILAIFCFVSSAVSSAEPVPTPRHLLYVATPGIRAETQYGGTGIAIFDIDHGHQFLRRIPIPPLGDSKHPMPAKGICASAATARLYVSTTKTLTCLDLTSDRIIWEKTYDSGCDRMSISPDGKWIYEPTLEGKFWHVIDGPTGT